jgi:hypothetical protein
MKRSTPCQGCEKRYPGCHTKCGDYQDWRNEYDEAKMEWKMKHLTKNHNVLGDGQGVRQRATRHYYKSGAKLWGRY